MKPEFKNSFSPSKGVILSRKLKIGSFFLTFFTVIYLFASLFSEDIEERWITFWSNRIYESHHQPSQFGRNVDFIVQLFNQYEAARMFRQNVLSRIHAPDETTWLLDALTQLRMRIQTQSSIPHTPAPLPDMVAGLGWCDQVNAMAAMVLAQKFETVEVFALKYPNGSSPHSIGRLYNKSTGDWTYFDIWSEYVIIFKKHLGRPLQLIAVQKGVPRKASYELSKMLNLYSATVDSGYTLSRLKGSFFEQISDKVRWKLEQRLGRNHSQPTLAIAESQLGEEASSMSIAEPPIWAALSIPAESRLEKIIPDGAEGRLFFEGRVNLLRGKEEEALKIFARLYETLSVDPMVADAAKALLERNIKRSLALAQWQLGPQNQ